MKTLAFVVLTLAATPAFAVRIQEVVGVPTLDEVGLLALVGLIGGVGSYLAMRRKK